MTIEKTGDWEAFGKLLIKAQQEFRSNVEKATNTNGRMVEGRIVERMQGNQVQPPTSKEFAEWKQRHGYSVTTLVMTSDLLNSVKYDKRSWNEGFVGVNRNAQSKDGTKLSSLAAVHEYGSIKGRTPARPFVAPVVLRSEREIVANYEKAVKEAFSK